VDHGLVKSAVEKRINRVPRSAEIERLLPLCPHRVSFRARCVGYAQVGVEQSSEAL
jgi:hypothetical protein